MENKYIIYSDITEDMLENIQRGGHLKMKEVDADLTEKLKGVYTYLNAVELGLEDVFVRGQEELLRKHGKKQKREDYTKIGEEVVARLDKKLSEAENEYKGEEELIGRIAQRMCATAEFYNDMVMIDLAFVRKVLNKSRITQNE